jgi:hypothetical protein
MHPPLRLTRQVEGAMFEEALFAWDAVGIIEVFIWATNPR